MNRQEILDMVAGSEIDRKIASEIFKYELIHDWTYNRCKINSVITRVFGYSESMDSAMLIIELLRKNAIYLNIETHKNVYVVSAYYPDCAEYIEVLSGDSLPLLICKVALLCNMYKFVTLEV